MRGSPADRILPKPGWLRIAPGLSNATPLNRLKNSMRNCNCPCSARSVLLTTPRFVLNSRGPRRMFFPGVAKRTDGVRNKNSGVEIPLNHLTVPLPFDPRRSQTSVIGVIAIDAAEGVVHSATYAEGKSAL